jgi:integrase
MVSKTGKHDGTRKSKVVSSTGDTIMFRLPHYTELKADGIYRYRRRVAPKLQEIVGKARLYRNLGKTKADVLNNYSRVHSEIEALLSQAQDTLIQQKETSAKAKEDYAKKSERDKVLHLVQEHYGKEASEMLAIGQVDRNFEGALMGLADELAGDIDETTERMLWSGRVPDEVITLSSVFDAYYDYKKTDRPKDNKRLHNRLMANKRNLITSWGSVKVEKMPVEQLTRKDANVFRDFLLLSTKPSSVSRNISLVSATINWYSKENGLDLVSPFNGIIIKDAGHTKNDRLPLTVDEISQVSDVIRDKKAWPMWVMMRDTGMRTAEVSGLLVGDISLQDRTVTIQPNKIRDLKTAGSQRTIPLSDELVGLLQPHRQNKDDDAALFSSYGTPTGADALSASLRKHLRTVIKEKRKVPYSLRHSMKDALRNIGIDGDMIDAILGHSGQSVGSRYGSGYNTDIMRKALEKVWV